MCSKSATHDIFIYKGYLLFIAIFNHELKKAVPYKYYTGQLKPFMSTKFDITAGGLLVPQWYRPVVSALVTFTVPTNITVINNKVLLPNTYMCT